MLGPIIVPLDGSTCAGQALEYALDLAKARGAQISVCSVVDPIAIAGRNMFTPLKEKHMADAKIEADRVVTEALAKARTANVAADGQVRFGEPWSEIVEQAASTAAAAIIMGTHGRSGFRRFFMGSVAQEVLRSAPCPVLIVRETVCASSRPGPLRKIDAKAPLSVLRLIEVAPKDFERLYGEIASFMAGPGAELPGISETQLLGSVDERRIVILAEFHSHSDWVHAQWDAKLGELLEEIAVNSQTLEFNLYRGDRFSARATAEQPVALDGRA